MNQTQITLLQRIQRGDPESWRQADDLYRPLIRGWLSQFGFEATDLDDLAQEVMLSLARHVAGFEHRGQLGAFRCWLKTITVNRARDFARRGHLQPRPRGGTAFMEMLDQVQDMESNLSRRFDRQHDVHVVAAMLDQVRLEFSPETIESFQQHVIEGRGAADVALGLGVSRWSVYQAKSRVLRRMRERIGPWSAEFGLA